MGDEGDIEDLPAINSACIKCPWHGHRVRSHKKCVRVVYNNMLTFRPSRLIPITKKFATCF